MAKKYVLISLVSRKDQMTKEQGRAILSLFYDKYPELAPQFANFFEPVNQPINNADEAINFWQDTALYRRKNKVVGSWNIGKDRNSIDCFDLQYNWHAKTDWLNIFKDLTKITETYFAYLHVFTDLELQPAYMGSAIDCFLHGTPSVYLKKGIPNLAWANYYSDEYAKEVDPELLREHGVSVEKQGNGYLFHLTDDIQDVIKKYDEFDAKRQEVKSLFCPGLFRKYEPYDN